MIAFLFIPPTTGTAMGRRVDFAKIAHLFAEADEPVARRDRRELARIAVLVLILLGAIGDTVLVMRPDPLTGCPATATAPHAAPTSPARATTL